MNKPSESSGSKANINDWAKKLKEISSKLDFARKIDEPRSVGFENLDRFDLPQMKTYNIELSDFHDDPEYHFSRLESRRCYFSLQPKIDSLKRYGERGLDIKQTLVYIRESVKPESLKDYTITIGPFNDNIIGGNIIVDKTGDFIFEFKRGTQTEVARGNAEAQELHFMKKDDFLSTFNFSFDDTHLRNLAHKALMAVPHAGSGREVIFAPGYYEVVVVDKDGAPTVYFLDYRDNDGYCGNLFQR